jgi:hypothetical protein
MERRWRMDGDEARVIFRMRDYLYTLEAQSTATLVIRTWVGSTSCHHLIFPSGPRTYHALIATRNKHEHSRSRITNPKLGSEYCSQATSHCHFSCRKCSYNHGRKASVR